MKPALTYSLKVLLTTAVLSSILITAVQFYFMSVNNLHPFHNAVIYNKELLGLLKSIGLTWILFLPLGLGIYYSVILLSKWQISLFWTKACLSVIGIILATLLESSLLYSILQSNTGSLSIKAVIVQLIHIMICHILSVLGSIWLYKLTLTPNVALKQIVNEV
jgi:hypothetical protein